jgi:hypothetical protein
MSEEFVSFDQAVALMYLGFDEKCMAGYDEDFGKLYIGFSTDDGVLFNPTYHTLAPLKQQVFRWFREKHNILHTSVFPLKITASDKEGYRYSWEIIINEQEEWVVDESPLGYYTYEEAENACIDKLISICKQQDK